MGYSIDSRPEQDKVTKGYILRQRVIFGMAGLRNRLFPRTRFFKPDLHGEQLEIRRSIITSFSEGQLGLLEESVIQLVEDLASGEGSGPPTNAAWDVLYAIIAHRMPNHPALPERWWGVHR